MLESQSRALKTQMMA